MNHRVNTIACALLLSALVVPASQAGDQRTPGKRHQIVAQAQSKRLWRSRPRGQRLPQGRIRYARIRGPRR